MRTIGIGLIGAARITPEAILAPLAGVTDARAVAIAARDPERARLFAQAHGVPEVEATYEALIARPDVDIVYVATPPALHAPVTIAALRRGKAVLCEKPFAANVADAEAMVEAARQAGQPLLEALHYRFHPAMTALKAAVDEGRIGRLRRAEARFETAIERRAGELRWSQNLGGGALLDLGCYAVHALRTLFAAEPSVLSARHELVDGVDAATSATLTFPGGGEAELVCSMVAPAKAKRLTLEGEAGRAALSNFVVPHAGSTLSIVHDGVETVEDVTGAVTTFQAQMGHVLQVVRGKAAPLTGGEDALANMRALEAISRAARSKPAAQS